MPCRSDTAGGASAHIFSDTEEKRMEWEKQFDEVALSRGKNLVKNGRVTDIKKTDTEITASVTGTPRYDVMVGMKDGEPVRMRCHCPKFRGRSNCEHLAAALYAAFEEEMKAEERERKRQEEQEQENRASEWREMFERLAREAMERKERQEERRRRKQEAHKEKEAPATQKAEETDGMEKDGSLQKMRSAKPDAAEKNQPEKRDREHWEILAEDSDYSYFDFVKIRKALRISPDSLKQGNALRQSQAVSLIRVFNGYTESRQDMAVEITATGRDRKKEFPIKLVFTKTDVLHVECSCPNCVKNYLYWYNKYRDCAYVSAVLDLSSAYIRKHGIGDATDKTAIRMLNALHQRNANQLVAKAEHQEESLRLVPRLQKQEDVLRLSFKVGSGKLFVVKDLFEFCFHVRNGDSAVYGSNTEINHQVENFNQDGRKWYAFLNKVIQEEERMEQRMEESMRYSYRGSRLAALELYGWRLDQFFEMLGSNSIEFEEKFPGKKEKGTLSGIGKNPKLSMQIAKSKGEPAKAFHGITVTCQMPEFFYGVDSAYYIEGAWLCRADREFMARIQTIADAARGGSLQFQIGRRQLSEFYYSMLPALGDSVEIQEEDKEEIHAFLPPEVQFFFYLDAQDGNMTCRPNARYGEKTVSLLEHLEETGNTVIQPFRMKNRETEILYRVRQLFPAFDTELGVLHCMGEEERMYQVLEHGVSELMELGEVHCTKRFREMNLVRRVRVSVGVSVSEGLLNLDIGTEDISRQELLDILKGYRTRQKFYRLKNGDFLNLEDNSLQMLNELMETLHVTSKEFLKGNMKLPAYRALYMDKLLEENENIYNTRDSHFRKMVKNFKTISDADFEEPESLTHILRGYQKNGYKWLRTLESYGFGGILADDMGLGKTLQMIAVLLAAKQEGKTGTSLIVSPASLVYNWEEELHRFAPGLLVAAVAGTQEARWERLDKSREYDVLITSYDLLKRDIDRYEGKVFLYEVIDEAQYIKNHTTAAAKAVKVITAKHKFALTGTPIENRLSELWSIFDYLMPGFLYGYDVFKRELEIPIAKAGEEDALKRLQKMTGPFILRRRKQDVLKDLPDKLEEVRYVQLEDAQRRAYDAQVVHMQERLRGQDSEEFNRNKMQIFAELTRLRQICCDPSLCFENYRGESAKLEACLELVESAIDGGHKILLFSQFTSMLEILQGRLSEKKIPFYTITGATEKEKRLQMVKAFNADDTPLFLISLKAGGVGLNLTGADVVLHYDPWWNLAAQDQATDRAHRIGQTKKVTVYKLIARQTVEEKILALQETKRDLADSIINAQTGQLAGMSKEELLALLEA